MKKKLLISELNRMREMMGLNLISETRLKSLITEGDGLKGLATLGLGGKSVDNLTKAGIDAAADLSKLSDEFATLTGKQNPTMDDFLKIVGDSLKKNSDELTDAEVTAYVKNNEKLYNSILKKAADEATKIVDELMKNMSLKTLFDDAKIPQVYDNLKTLAGFTPTKSNVDTLEKYLDEHIVFVNKLVDDNPGNKELEEMAAQLAGKKEDCVKFKGESIVSNTATQISEIFAKTDLIIKSAKEMGITATDEMITTVKGFFDSIGDSLTDRLNNDLQLIPAGGGPIPSGNIWEKLEPFYKMEYNSYGGGPKKSFADHFDRFTTSLGKIGTWWGSPGRKFLYTLGLFLLVMFIWASLKDGSAKKAIIDTSKEIIDLTLTPDTKFEDCIENLPGYSELTNDQKKYSAIYVACDENCLGFSKISETKFQIGFKGTPTCLETHVINTGGLSGVKESGNCKGGSNTTGGKKYTCKDNVCVEDPNGEFNESTCGGSCGGNNEEEEEKVVAHTNDNDGFQSWCSDKGYTDCSFSGLWYKDKTSADKQASYADGTFN